MDLAMLALPRALGYIPFCRVVLDGSRNFICLFLVFLSSRSITDRARGQGRRIEGDEVDRIRLVILAESSKSAHHLGEAYLPLLKYHNVYAMSISARDYKDTRHFPDSSIKGDVGTG